MNHRAPLVLLAAVALAGCSTHEPRFEQDVPPPPADAVGSPQASLKMATDLAQTFRSGISTLPPDALSWLAQATSLAFRAQGAPGMRSLARQYADALLEARVASRGGVAFYGSRRPGVADVDATAIAADALIDAYVATRESRYRRAVVGAARALAGPELGWGRVDGRWGIRAQSRVAGLDIARTAFVARVLERAADREFQAGTRDAAQAGFATVVAEQEGLGRWYATTRGRTPMNVQQWAVTLFTLADSPHRRLRDVSTAGVPALWNAMFTSDGQLRRDAPPDPDRRGLAWSVSTFNVFLDDPRYGTTFSSGLLGSRRPDGTVSQFPAADAPLQALFAVGLARRGWEARRAAG